MFENVILNYLKLDDNNVHNVDELIDSYNQNDMLDVLKDKLMNLRIIDPNCGNGRYLIDVTRLLFKIHEKLMQYDENPNMTKHAWMVYDSIHGIDRDKHNIDECKFKLTKIFNEYIPDFTTYYFHAKIIHANALVEDPLICPDAFRWSDMFNNIINNGGFDICLGNISFNYDKKSMKSWGEYLADNYLTYSNIKNIYSLFFEKAMNNLKDNGVLSFISPNMFLNSLAQKKIRRYLLTYFIDSFFDYRNMDKTSVFLSDLCMITLSKINKSNDMINVNNKFTLNQNYLNELRFNFFNREIFEVYDDIMLRHEYVRDFDFTITHRGVHAHFNKDFIIDEETYNYLMYHEPESSHFIKPVIKGCDISKNSIKEDNRYVIFLRDDINIQIDEYPFIKNYLYHELGESYPNDGYFNEHDYIKNERFEIKDYRNDYKIYENPKIIYPLLNSEIFAIWDDENYYLFDNLGMITCDDTNMLKLLYAMFNSKVYKFLVHMKMNILGKVTSVKKDNIETLPFVIPDEARMCLIVENVDKLINHDYKDNDEKIFLEYKLNFLVYSLFGLSYHEVDVIENYLEQIMLI